MGRVYLAYGSNINIEQMNRRCPTAKFLGKTKLKGWKLEFRGMGSNCHATIAPHEGSDVLALLWELEMDDERSLDIYEGYPRYYLKETVKAELSGELIEAMAYVMAEGYSLGKPSYTYYNIIRTGYEKAGFDVNILDRAVAESAIASGDYI